MLPFNCWSGLRGPSALLLILINTTFLWAGTRAAQINRTIDDVFGDSETFQRPVYLPTTKGVWKDQTCSDCVIRPDTNLAFHNTYTSATYHPELGSVNVTMDFNGTAIYVFFILVNNAGAGVTTNTNCTFKLDNQVVGSFEHVPDLTTTNVQFGVPVFSKTGIPFGQHRLVVATEGLNVSAYINFDRVIYTSEDQPVPSSTAAPQTAPPLNPTLPQATSSSALPQGKGSKGSIAGAVVGGIIGAAACLAIIGILLWSRLRRRRNLPPRINLVGPIDDEFDPKDRGGIPTYHVNGLAMTSTIHTFAATEAPFPSAQPPTSEPPTLSQRDETPNPRYSTQVTHSPMVRPHGSFRVVNPGPESPNPDQDSSVQRAELEKQLTAMRGELEYSTANLWSSRTGSARQSLLSAPSTSGSERTSHRNYRDATVSELREQVRVLAAEVAKLRALQSTSQPQGSTSDSPPGYAISQKDQKDLPDIPFPTDQKQR